MMLTEDDARQRWCPHARVAFYAPHATSDEGPAAVNRDTPDPAAKFDEYRANVHAATRCVGSACLAWRWAPMPRMVVSRDSLTDADLAVLADPSWGGVIEYRRDGDLPQTVTRLGYCGLAGKP